MKLVKFDYDSIPIEYHKQYPFISDRVYVLIGEINNLQGCCVVADNITGQIHSGFHTENFIELTEEEL